LDLDHDAHMLHAAIGSSLPAAWSPRLALQFDHLSGDSSHLDLSSGRFDPLFGDRSFEFGPTSIYGAIARANLASPGIRSEAKPDSLSDAYIMIRQIELDPSRASFGDTSTRDPAGSSGKDVGAQIEGRYRRWLVQHSLASRLARQRGSRAIF
jgi:hypothetical protein